MISGFTLEQYRGKGLFSSIITSTSKIFDFVMTLSASPEAQIAYKKLNWKIFDNLNRYVVVLNKKRFDAFVGTTHIEEAKTEKSSLLKRITELPKDYEIFWEQVKCYYPITTNKTKKYLNWRFLNHPLIDYHFVILEEDNIIVGYAVIRFETNNDSIKAARIVDLIIIPKFESEIFKQILNYCHDKVDFIDFL